MQDKSKVEIVVMCDVGFYLKCFLGTADRLRMLSESLLAEILEQVQAKSEVGLERASVANFDLVLSEIGA